MCGSEVSRGAECRKRKTDIFLIAADCPVRPSRAEQTSLSPRNQSTHPTQENESEPKGAHPDGREFGVARSDLEYGPEDGQLHELRHPLSFRVAWRGGGRRGTKQTTHLTLSFPAGRMNFTRPIHATADEIDSVLRPTEAILSTQAGVALYDR